MQKEIRENIQTTQKAMKTAYDKKHYGGSRYDVGEVVVMLKQPNPSQLSKLQAKYRIKPLQVVEVLTGNTYQVAELATDRSGTFATTAHVS